MVARTLILIIITALVLVGFVFMVPVDVVLKARGYTPEQISQVKALRNPTDAATQANDPKTSAQSPASSPTDPASTPAAAEKPAQNADTEESEPATQAAPPPKRQFVATDTINVRAGQGTNTDVVGQFAPKTLVTVLEDPTGDWMKVEGGDVTGWVYKPLFEPKQ